MASLLNRNYDIKLITKMKTVRNEKNYVNPEDFQQFACTVHNALRKNREAFHDIRILLTSEYTQNRHNLFCHHHYNPKTNQFILTFI